MDDTQNNGMNQQPTVPQPSTTDPNMMQPGPQVSSMGDLAGMTPPPAPMQGSDPSQMGGGMGMPVQDNTPSMPGAIPGMSDMGAAVTPAPTMPEPAPVMPSAQPMAPTAPMSDMGVSPSAPMQDMPTGEPMHHEKPEDMDDYTYAEDLLDEILDSLDRIEAKLEAIEKKVG